MTETVETEPAKACCPCKRCGENTCGENQGSDLVRNGATGGYERLCRACYVQLWPSEVKFHFAYGLPSWVEERMRTYEVLQRLTRWFRLGPQCQVYFVHRKDTDTLAWQYLWNQWDHDKRPRGLYSYRGWCGGGKIVIIVDSEGIETGDSIEWLTYHELGHHEQQGLARMSDHAWYAENKNEGREGYDWESDAGHEADSEERHVNRVATAFMGGKEYARAWWRPRVQAAQGGLPIPPDPNAEPATP
jgi:hypothetical protein